MNIIKKVHIRDLYRGCDINDFKRGVMALTLYKRIAHCLEAGLDLNVSDEMAQWTEERSPNHHKYAYSSKWPVGFINVESPANRVDEIINYSEFKNYYLKILSGSNSSGGVKPETIDQYVFSVSPPAINESTKETVSWNYNQLENAINNEFKEDSDFKLVGSLSADYVRLGGFDVISGGIIYIDVGNRPVIKSYPKTWFGSRKDIGQIPPLDSVKIPVV